MPPDVPIEFLLLLAMVSAIPLVVAVLVIAPYLQKKVAQLEVQEGELFELQARPNDDRPHRVWLRYRVKWTGPGKTMYGYGLACRVRCLVDDRVAFDEVVGVGRSVEGLNTTKRVTTKYATVSSAGHSGGSETASIFLGETGQRPLGTSIVATGEILSAEATTVEFLKVYVTR